MKTAVLEELWKDIIGYDNYQISNLGHVYNKKLGRMLSPSMNNFGQLRVNLRVDYDYRQHTKSLSRLVAEAFVERPDRISDSVILLDGDFFNCVSTNLRWRPRAFTWRYTHQMKEPQPTVYFNLPVKNKLTHDQYDCIYTAGKTEGLLFEDIWFSVNSGKSIYPTHAVYEVIPFDF